MSRKLLNLSIVVLTLLVLSVVPIYAHEAADIYIDGLWATPCTQTNNITSVFMTIDNTAVSHPIALIGASSPVAESTQLIEGDGGCSEGMVERIVIPFGERLDFRESRYAIAVKMNEKHEPGAPFSLTLTFDMLDEDLKSQGTTVDVVVGVPILEEAPAPSNILVTTPWTLPTSTEKPEGHEGHDHSSSEKSAEASMFPAAVYMRLLNRGKETERLIAASSPVAEETQIHQTTMNGEVMSMREIDGLDLPAGEWVALERGGYHIMLLGLQRELYEGDVFPLTLTLESGKEITVIVPVYDPMGDMHDMHDHSDHKH